MNMTNVICNILPLCNSPQPELSEYEVNTESHLQKYTAKTLSISKTT